MPLQLEAKIPLGAVSGRIDHMAIDLARQRLFVAELGNNSVGIIDIKDRRVLHRIASLKEPQGLAYLPQTDTVYVTNGGDGSVRLFRGADHVESGRIDLADDADNIRLDLRTNRILVGYGNGALAIIDPSARTKAADIQLKAHPEGFQLGTSTGLTFVNVPKAREIAVIDRNAGKQVAGWPVGNDSTFPMALDLQARRVLVVSRSPAALAAFSMDDGAAVVRVETCGDADDLFVDAKRQRTYVSCGEGFVDVFDTRDKGYRRIAHIPTIPGARTALFVPELDRLFLATRAARGESASIWIFRTSP
jgi:DNA-binding beta-propeller fold protein YncE